MNKRQRMLVSLACATLAMALFALYASRVRGEADRERTEMLKRYGGEVVSIAVASHTIEAGEVASTSNVTLTDWVASLVPEDALLSLDDVVGREVSVPVSAGVPLTELNFRNAAELADIPAGHVAIAIPASDQLGLAAGIAAGSHVVAYRVGNGTAEPLSSDVTILATPATAGSISGRGSLTVAIASSDVPEFLSASSSGSLRLVIPASSDKEKAPAPSEALPTDEVSATAPTVVEPVDVAEEEQATVDEGAVVEGGE